MIKNDNITLYAIRGLPGSGKTSFAKSLNLNFYEADIILKNLIIASLIINYLKRLINIVMNL